MIRFWQSGCPVERTRGRDWSVNYLRLRWLVFDRTGHFEVRPNNRIFGWKPNRTTEYSAEPISTKDSAESATFFNFPPLFNNFTGNFKVWNQIMVINSKIANMFLQCFHGQNNFNFSIVSLMNFLINIWQLLFKNRDFGPEKRFGRTTEYSVADRTGPEPNIRPNIRPNLRPNHPIRSNTIDWKIGKCFE